MARVKITKAMYLLSVVLDVLYVLYYLVPVTNLLYNGYQILFSSTITKTDARFREVKHLVQVHPTGKHSAITWGQCL
jgi:hypothetical protein